MKISYLANIRLPTEKAHGLHIMKACEALTALGHNVELIVPKRWTPVKEQVNEYYRIRTPFPIVYLPIPDTVRNGWLGFNIHRVLFAFGALVRVLSTRPDLVYGRDELVLCVVSLIARRKVVWESHDGGWNMFARYLARHAVSVVVVSEGLKDFYIKKGVSANRLCAVANGIELADFLHPESKQEARTRLGLPLDTPLALYIGRLDGWKGTDTLIEAAKLLAPQILVAFIGGEDPQVAELRKKHPDLCFLGHRPYSELADNQAAADVLVLPNTGKSDISTSFTSPLKLLSYMASSRAIVASDLPSVRELVGEDSAVFVAPDSPEALAQGIRELMQDTSRQQTLARNALERVQTHTWKARAEHILSSVETAQEVRILAIYRGKLTENRGTPIRVRSLLERISAIPGFSVTVASWDDHIPFEVPHLHLTNSKLADMYALLRVVHKERIQCVVGHTMATWYYLAFLKMVSRAKLVLEMHGFIEREAYFYGSISKTRMRLWAFVYRMFYPLMDLITTCSENAVEILAPYNKNIVPIYGGVDTDLFNPETQALASVHKEPGTVLIGYAGNTRKWQGVPFLLDSFKTLYTQDPSFRLALLSSESKELPPQEGVEYYGQVAHEEVPAFLAACDILVIPRLDDEISRISFPSKLPEYLAMGKPVVASSTSDAHKVITDRVDGYLFTPGDTASFLSILHILEDERLRKHIGMAARETALSRFRWKSQSAILATRLRAVVYPYVKS